MPKSHNPIKDALSNPNNNFLLFFFVGVIGFSFITDGVNFILWHLARTLFQKYFWINNEFSVRLVTIVFCIPILLLFSTNVLTWLKETWISRGIVASPVEAKVNPINEYLAGLVVIMSPKATDSPAEVAIRYHWNNGQAPHLHHCWIICTESSFEAAETMHQNLIRELGIGGQLNLYYGNYTLPDPHFPNQTRSLILTNDQANDPDNILQLIEAIYQDAETKGLDESELVVDFTGGTKTLSIGAFLACVQPQRRLQYITQQTSNPIVEIKVNYDLKQRRSTRRP